MFRYQIKTAFRIILRDKFHSILNIFGLAIGLACVLLMLLFLRSEYSYDKHHVNHENLFRYGVNMTIGGVSSSQSTVNLAVGPILKEQFPGIYNYTRFRGMPETMIEYKGKTHFIRGLYVVDNSVFELFTHSFLKGDQSSCLIEKNSIVLTKSLAEKVFGQANPVGESITLDNSELFIVTGVIEDLPDNVHASYQGLISMSTIEDAEMQQSYSPAKFGGGMTSNLYFLFHEHYTAEQFYDDFQKFYEKNLKEIDQINYKPIVEPIADIYLNSQIWPDYSQQNRNFLYGFSGVCIFIIIIAMVNYINIATTRFAKRAKEIGIKKIVGSTRRQLIYQFMAESLIQTFLSTFLAIILLELLIEFSSFNELINKSLEINIFTDSYLISFSILVALICGLLSGIYPAFYLSKLSPIQAIKNLFFKKPSLFSLRKLLVGFQFILSIAVISLMLIMNHQLKYILNMDLGMDDENVVVIHAKNETAINSLANYKKEILNYHKVNSAALSNHSVGENISGIAIDWEDSEGKMDIHAFNWLAAEPDFFKTLNIPVVEGNVYKQNDSANFGTFQIVVNDRLVDYFGWKEAVGKKCQAGLVVGVVKNFKYQSLHTEDNPIFMIQKVQNANILYVNISLQNLSETVEYLQQSWEDMECGHPFTFTFLSDRLQRLYEQDIKQKKLAGIFTLICIIVACLGLFGLTSYTTAQKSKEIAIRKVNGARVLNVVYSLFREIIVILIISTVLAAPLAYFGANVWLGNYAFKIDVNVLYFLISGIIAMIIAFATALYHIARLTSMNPARLLRYE